MRNEAENTRCALHQLRQGWEQLGQCSLSARSAQPVTAHTAVQTPLSGALRGELGGQPAPAPVLPSTAPGNAALPNVHAGGIQRALQA